MSLILSTATAAPAGAGAGITPFLIQMAPLLLVFVAFYFMILRPQQRRAADHAARIAAAKRGDTVVTGGGLIGKVTKVMADEVEIEIAPTVKVRAVTATLVNVRLHSLPNPQTTDFGTASNMLDFPRWKKIGSLSLDDSFWACMLSHCPVSCPRPRWTAALPDADSGPPRSILALI